MTQMRIRPSRPTTDLLEELRIDQLHTDLTYDAIGQTLSGNTPSGFRSFSVERELDSRPDAMKRARSAIRDWAGHHRAGVVVHPGRAPLDAGVVVTMAARTFGLWTTSCWRIVHMFDTEHEFGFVYGTLPHHVEIGEEAFVARRRDDGTVVIRVSGFSRHHSIAATAVGPLTKMLQSRLTNAYVDGLVGAAALETTN